MCRFRTNVAVLAQNRRRDGATSFQPAHALVKAARTFIADSPVQFCLEAKKSQTAPFAIYYRAGGGLTAGGAAPGFSVLPSGAAELPVV
jgi:hypothetical protein